MIDTEFNLNLEEIKAGFFSLMDGATRMARKNSEILGAQTRKAAQNSMKRFVKLSKKMQKEIKKREDASGYRLSGSLPGQPPLERVGLLKKHIYYAWDPKENHVVVGPVKLPRLGEVPHSLEFGMTTLNTGIDARGKPIVIKVRLEPRPYMRPALDRVMEPANVARVYEKSLKKFVKKVSKKLK